MAVFAYQACPTAAVDSASPAVLRGTIAADSPRHARELLRDRDLDVIAVDPAYAVSVRQDRFIAGRGCGNGQQAGTCRHTNRPIGEPCIHGRIIARCSRPARSESSCAATIR